MEGMQMAKVIQSRGDTAVNWSSINPVLHDREIGIETDTRKFKIGNGTLAWNDLGYAVGAGGSGSYDDTAITGRVTDLENGTTPAGNANQLGGNAPSHYATASDLATKEDALPATPADPANKVLNGNRQWADMPAGSQPYDDTQVKADIQANADAIALKEDSLPATPPNPEYKVLDGNKTWVDMPSLEEPPLPVNMNKNEYGTNPTYVARQNSAPSRPKVSFQLSESPVADILPFMRKIEQVEPVGSSCANSTNIPELIENTLNRVSFGFWIKDDGLEPIFSNGDIEFWLYSGGRYLRTRFDLLTAISSVGVSVPVTFDIAGTNDYWDSAESSVSCLHKEKGWTYLKIDWFNLVWQSGYVPANNFRFYMIFNRVRQHMLGNPIFISNFTILFNDEITTGYSRYPDGGTVTQKKLGDEEDMGFPVGTLKVVIDKARNAGKEPLNTNDEYDILIRTKHDAFKEIVRAYQLWHPDSRNNTINPRGIRLCGFSAPFITGTYISATGDEGCPVVFNQGYIGGNHGHSGCRRVTLTNHGKTYADIGSEWHDSDNHSWWIVAILDDNNFWMLGENILTPPFYQLRTDMNGTTLTHVTGAVNTSTMNGVSINSDQMLPAVRHVEKKAMLDGRQLEADGTYIGKVFDIIETYDIINPAEIASWLISNRPAGGYTENPVLNQTSAVVRITNIYRFLPDGTLTVILDFWNYIDVNFEFLGITQVRRTLRSLGGADERYIPKTLPFNENGVDYDFRIPYDLNGALPNKYFDTTTWEYSDNPPNRDIDYMRDSSGNRVFGLAVGYLPTGEHGKNRDTRTDTAYYMASSKKRYPRFINDTWKDPLPAGNSIQGVAYRKPFKITNHDFPSYEVFTKNKAYIFIDCFAEGSATIKVSDALYGKEYTVLEKSDNVNVVGDVVTAGGIKVTSSARTPQTGFIVLEVDL